MSPTLKNNDFVLVSRLSYLFSKPKPEDIIAARDPRDKKTIIKRISKISKDIYFILGDNKKASTDSRTFGWIAKKDIIGKVIYNSKIKI